MAQDIPLTEKQTFWFEHLQACTASGLSMRAYAESRDLSISALYAWKKALQRKGVFANTPPDESPLFRKAMLTDYRAGHVRVQLPTGLVLEFDTSADPRWVGELLRALP